MVLANRPWLLAAGLKSALVAALATRRGGDDRTDGVVARCRAGAGGGDLGLHRDHHRLDRDRTADSGTAPTMTHLNAAGEIPSLQHLDAADSDHRHHHLLSGAVRREPGLGAVRARHDGDERSPRPNSRRGRSVRAHLVRRIGGDSRRGLGHRPGIRRRDPRPPRTRSARRSGAPAWPTGTPELISDRSEVPVVVFRGLSLADDVRRARPEKKSWFSSAFGESADRIAGFTFVTLEGNIAS